MPAARASSYECQVAEDGLESQEEVLLSKGAEHLRRRRRAIKATAGAGCAFVVLLSIIALLCRRGGLVVGMAAQARLGAVVGLHWDQGMLRWQGRHGKCLDVAHGKAAPGTPVQLWDCDKLEGGQYFIFPRGKGMIRWEHHPDLCVGVAGGKLHNGNSLVLGTCDDHTESMQWVMPPPGKPGPIRSVQDPTKCIDESHGHGLRNGADARVGPCPKSVAWDEELEVVTGQLRWSPEHGSNKCMSAAKPIPGEPIRLEECDARSLNNQFIFPGRFGMIRWSSYSDLCIDVPGGRTHNGQQLQLWRCDENITSMQWETGSGVGSMRMQHHRGKCLKADAASGVVRIHDCGDVRDDTRWNVESSMQPWGKPSLLCAAVMLPFGYEHSMLSAQLEKARELGQDVGIFACDEFQIFSKEEVQLGWHYQQGWVHTLIFKQAPVGVTKDGLAANGELFLNFWDAVIDQGRFLHHHWTVKVDPDCVLLPDRLRGHLAPFTEKGAKFVKNCERTFGDVDWHMMFGPAEMLSKDALKVYGADGDKCRELNGNVGEDVLVTQCFEALHAKGIWDFEVLSDDRCVGVDCRDSKAAAFHPFKTSEDWFSCWHDAVSR